MMTKNLVLHDYFAHAEGGGKLSSILAKAINADLGYGFSSPNHPFIQGAKHNPREHDMGVYSPIPLWQQWKLARAFEHRSAWVQSYQQIFYSGFYTPLAVHQAPHAQHILYCHTPPRFIYDQYDFYQQQLPKPLRPLLQQFCDYLQPRYEAAIAKMDIILCNSRHVQQRIKTHLGVEAQIIYPPCDTTAYRCQTQGDYYLSTARLDPLKRVDRLVQAFLALPDKKLIIASGGSELKKLKKLAGNAPNIQFTGWLSESQLHDLLGKAIATLYIPQAEDFGMSPIESMAAGKPVIAVAEGGLLESILANKTGLLLEPDFTQTALIDAIKQLDSKTALSWRAACEQRASQFDQSQFIKQIQQHIASLN